MHTKAQVAKPKPSSYTCELLLASCPQACAKAVHAFKSCQLADCGRLRMVALNPVPRPTKVEGTGGGPRAIPAEPRVSKARLAEGILFTAGSVDDWLPAHRGSSNSTKAKEGGLGGTLRSMCLILPYCTESNKSGVRRHLSMSILNQALWKGGAAQQEVLRLHNNSCHN